MGDSRKYPYLYHGWVLGFPKGRAEANDCGILRAWGIYDSKSKGMRGFLE